MLFRSIETLLYDVEGWLGKRGYAVRCYAHYHNGNMSSATSWEQATYGELTSLILTFVESQIPSRENEYGIPSAACHGFARRVLPFVGLGPIQP